MQCLSTQALSGQLSGQCRTHVCATSRQRSLVLENGRTVRSFSSSPLCRSDFYKTLDVGRDASQEQIKTSFYKLSKKWHPDVNQGSNEAKQKFQEVSEAYATLGSESSRKAYDRQVRSSSFATPRAGRGASASHYNSENLERKATATYAWEYQRRNAARQQRATSSHPRSQSYHPHRRESRSHPSLFEQFAERQRRREAATAARTGRSGISGLGAGKRNEFVSEEEHHAQTASPILRFVQVMGVFGIILYAASKTNNEPKRTRLR